MATEPVGSVEVELVTPALAVEWLTRSPCKLSELSWPRIRRMAEAALDWQGPADAVLLSADAIMFAPDGTLLDGKHRLATIAVCQRPLWLTVARDVTLTWEQIHTLPGRRPR